MTREEEICKAAEEFAFSHKTETSDFHDAINDFYYGAKWADENPQMRKDYEFLFMLKKRELIKNACDLLYAMLTNLYINDYDYVTAPAYDDVEDFVDDFRKTMEK